MEELKIRREVFNSDLEYVGPYILPFVQAHVYDFLKNIKKLLKWILTGETMHFLC